MDYYGKKSVTPKKLSFISIYFLGINGVIGSGAFLLPQTMYKDMNLMCVFVTIYVMLTYQVDLLEQELHGFIPIMPLVDSWAMN